MEIVNRINNQANQIKESFKSKTTSALLLTLKVISGGLIGLTFALVLQEMMRFGEISFLFIILMLATVFVRASKSWGYITLIIFDLFCVLLAMLLRMYIIIAPN